MRINKVTIEELLDHDPKPCEDDIDAALGWIGDRDEDLTADLWREFYDADPDHALWFLAEGPCPPGMLERLSEDANPGVRVNVALNTNCPPSLLERLSEDAVPGVRVSVASNDDSPRLVRERLSRDESPWVRRAAALLPLIP